VDLSRDEEDTGGSSTPQKDLIGSVAIAAVALVWIWLSLGLERPEGIATAPGLLPLVVAFALLVMSAVLALSAIKQGAARGLAGHLSAALHASQRSFEDRRVLLLAALMTAYVLLVAAIDFDFEFSLGGLALATSSYEVVSAGATATILRLFWRASWLRCAAVSVAAVEVLAWIFRYGFHILMPTAY
jgi:hypothetical protein